ncbi:DNA/RNA non-specific endonuclease [Hymenobacter baengnokdamensis]|uniref:DNA/RNA non-specific endonuclease n=1 Tax=Hymenobacter baengnokdamensis TaxID=2615203 RepID=UPI0012489BE0|nr:DNA/RNA non-specific endonuclease [Hymenobacter baengnokdamensis]
MKDFLLRRYYLLLLLLSGALHPGRLAAQSTQESFETGTKTDYPAATVALATGNWDFTDALLGTDANDHKNGSQAVRIEQTGRLTMDFYLPGGASLVTVQYAAYGADAGSGWELWAQSQSCSCNNWTKVSHTVLTTSSTLQTAAFSVSLPGSVRFEIRKVSGGAARLNFDDFTVAPYGAAPSSQYPDNDNLAMGNPTLAVTDETNYPDNYLLRKNQYAVSYNHSQGKPNWVSWHLDISDRGSSDRQNDFRPDSTLPADWYHVLATDYAGSGFDRGHNCPSADHTNSVRANSLTFLMSNMMPQAPNNNQHTWADLENYTRSFLPNYEVYIIDGSYGVGGTGSAGYMTVVPSGKVTVPSHTWKVIVLLPVGDNDVLRVNANTRIIAVDMPNDNSLSLDWGVYRTSVDAIESAVTATGLTLDLLSALPTSVQAVVEAKVDNGPTQ